MPRFVTPDCHPQADKWLLGTKNGTAQWVQFTEGDDDDQIDPDLPIWIVGGQASQPLTAILELNGKNVPMEVDTGAGVSLIAESIQQELFPQAVLEPSQVRLSTLWAEALKMIEVMWVQVRYDSYVGDHLL